MKRITAFAQKKVQVLLCFLGPSVQIVDNLHLIRLSQSPQTCGFGHSRSSLCDWLSIASRRFSARYACILRATWCKSMKTCCPRSSQLLKWGGSRRDHARQEVWSSCFVFPATSLAAPASLYYFYCKKIVCCWFSFRFSLFQCHLRNPTSLVFQLIADAGLYYFTCNLLLRNQINLFVKMWTQINLLTCIALL